VQDKFLHSSGKDASPRRPVVPAGRPYHEKNFVLRPSSTIAAKAILINPEMYNIIVLHENSHGQTVAARKAEAP
jgi:hypothetical protein